jgi:hypothetical protein
MRLTKFYPQGLARECTHDPAWSSLTITTANATPYYLYNVIDVADALPESAARQLLIDPDKRPLSKNSQDLLVSLIYLTL